MDKAGTGVVADPPQLQGDSRTSDRMQVGAWDCDVDRLADEVKAVLGDMATATRKQRIV